MYLETIAFPDNKVHGANMGPIWGRQDQVGPMLAPWTLLSELFILLKSHILDTYNLQWFKVSLFEYQTVDSIWNYIEWCQNVFFNIGEMLMAYSVWLFQNFLILWHFFTFSAQIFLLLIRRLFSIRSWDLSHCGLVTPHGNINLGRHWLKNGMLPYGTKPLPEPESANHQCGPVAFTWGKFHRKYPRYLSLILVWKWLIQV